MRTILVSMTALGALALAACQSPYIEQPDSLSMPKVKKPKPGAAQAGPPEPDTCKPAFDAPAIAIPKRALREQARSYAQDADNQLGSTSDMTDWARRRQIILSAISTLSDALRMDPYSPVATYHMAVGYAMVGKKKCAKELLIRLNDLGGIPDLVPEISKLKKRAKTELAFDSMRAEADAALP